MSEQVKELGASRASSDAAEDSLWARRGEAFVMMLETLRGFVRNRASITTHEPFEGALSRLMDLAEAAISKAEGAS